MSLLYNKLSTSELLTKAQCLSYCHGTTNPVSCQGGGGGGVTALCLSDCHVTTNPVFCQGGGSSPVSK